MLGRSLFIKKTFKEDIEPQEIFLDRLAQKKEEEIGISEKKFEVPLSERILQGLYLFFFILILILFAKTFQLQIVEGKDLSLLAEQNKFAVYSIKAERGVIYDKDFEQLVFNQPSFDLVCYKAELPKNEEKKTKVLEEVSYILGKETREIKEKIEKSQDPTVLISENLSHRSLILLEARLKELPGFEIKDNTVRSYKEGRYFSHLIGYTGRIKPSELQTSDDYTIKDYVGRDGLERTYEEILRKKSGKMRVEKDAFGNPIRTEIISLPESGKSLVLYLDSELQKKIVTEMEKAFERVGTEKGAAVAIDPRSGGVLALASFPNFDNNLFSKGISQEEWDELINNPLNPLFNRPIAGQYPTGSIIKPLLGSAALEEGIINERTKFYCPLNLCVENIYSHKKECFPDWTFHGWTDIKRAIAESVNPFFYIIGGGYRAPEDLLLENPNLPKKFEGLGVKKIKKYLELFGWGEEVKIDLPGAVKGRVPDPDWKKSYFRNYSESAKKWYLGDTYNLSIGQGYLLATPLQVCSAFVAIANNGSLLRPRVVKEIVDSDKRVIKEFKPEILRENFISAKNLEVIRQGMRQAVTSGSAVLLNDLPVKAAAKTGTAQISQNKNYFYNWVTVFAPYSEISSSMEEAEIVLTILIEDVKGEQVAALPVAKNVLEWYFSNRGK